MSGLPLQLPVDQRQALLLETLRVKGTALEPVPAVLKLPVAVTSYWLQHPEVKAQPHHLQALLLGMLQGSLQATLDSPGRWWDSQGIKAGGTGTVPVALLNVKAAVAKRHLLLPSTHVPGSLQGDLTPRVQQKRGAVYPESCLRVGLRAPKALNVGGEMG